MPRHREFDPAEDATPRPPRPTLRALTDASYPDILADYEEAILSGCSKDEAAAFSLISDFDHTSFLARVLSEDPDWLNNLTAVGKTNLKATARVQTARKVRAGDSAFVMPVVQAMNQDLSPKAPPPLLVINNQITPEEQDKISRFFPQSRPVIEAGVTEKT
jgi:hypothetical protein